MFAVCFVIKLHCRSLNECNGNSCRRRRSLLFLHAFAVNRGSRFHPKLSEWEGGGVKAESNVVDSLMRAKQRRFWHAFIYARHGFRTGAFSVFNNHVYIRMLSFLLGNWIRQILASVGVPGIPGLRVTLWNPWVQHVHATLRQFFVFPVRLFSLFVFLFD